MTLSNWKNQQMSSEENYLEPSVYFTAGCLIKKAIKNEA
jgi:hypothetical protein